MIAILVLLLIVFFGFSLTLVISKDLDIFERLGLGYLLGIGLVTLLVFYYSWIGVKITQLSILGLVLILILLTTIGVSMLKRVPKLRISAFKRMYISLKWYEKVILLVIFTLFLLSFALASYFPINAWDALALYDFRAKVIASLGYFVQIQGNFNYFAQYPLLTSLTHVIIYLFGGKNPQFTYPIYYVSLALVVFGTLKNNSGRLVALLAVLYIVTLPNIFQHSTIAYTNLPYTVYYVIGMIYLYNAIYRNKYELIVLSALLIGLSTWVRADEPFWLTAGIAVIIYSLYKRSFIPIFLYFPIFLLIQQPWSIYQAHLFGQAYSTTGQFALGGKSISDGINVERMFEVTIYIYKNVILSWGLLTVPFILAAILDIKNRFDRSHLIVLAIIFINLVGLFVGTYVFSFKVPGWKDIPDSAKRLAMFFPSLMIYYISLVFSSFVKTQKISLSKRK